VINFTRDISKNNLIYLFSYEGLPHLQGLIRDCIPEKYQTPDGKIEIIERELEDKVD